MALNKEAHKKQSRFLLGYALQSLGIILVLAILLRSFLISSYVVSGTAMLPSVWPGDFLLAFKWGAQSPKRGDLMTLKCPQEQDLVCLKRVVAIPGDRIEFANGQLIVNGEPGLYEPVEGGAFIENLLGQRRGVMLERKRDKSIAPLVVPPQQVYLLNDNREMIVDSRVWGPVPMELLEGRAIGVWLSLDWYEGTDVRAWPKPRWHRMLQGID